MTPQYNLPKTFIRQYYYRKKKKFLVRPPAPLHIITRSISQSLLISQQINTRVTVEKVSDRLILTQSILLRKTSATITVVDDTPCSTSNLEPQYRDILSIVQCINYTLSHAGVTVYDSISQGLLLEQSIHLTRSKHLTLGVFDSLLLNQSISKTFGNISTRSISQSVPIIDSFIVQLIRSRSVNDSLPLTQSIFGTTGDILTRSISQTLVLNQSFTKPKATILTVSDSLSTLHDLFVKKKVTTIKIKDHLSLNQLVNNPIIRHNLAIHQTLVFLDNYTRDFNYTTQLPIPILIYNVIPYKWKKKQYCQLATNSGNRIFLPAASFGNQDSLTNSLNLKRSILGNVFTYKKTTNTSRIKLDFQITESKYQELEFFIESNETRFLTIVDWTNKMYFGYLTNNLEATNSDRDLWEVSMEFETMGIG